MPVSGGGATPLLVESRAAFRLAWPRLRAGMGGRGGVVGHRLAPKRCAPTLDGPSGPVDPPRTDDPFAIARDRV